MTLDALRREHDAAREEASREYDLVRARRLVAAHRAAEEDRPTLGPAPAGKEAECRCASLIWGHEPGCPWSKSR
jgi:hypothetical protein